MNVLLCAGCAQDQGTATRSASCWSFLKAIGKRTNICDQSLLARKRGGQPRFAAEPKLVAKSLGLKAAG
jgi:hypothetical protein